MNQSVDTFFAFTAFAVEGQVKEKSRWFSSLRDLTRKLKVLKTMFIGFCVYDQRIYFNSLVI